MNKINPNIDFIFASKNDCIANLEENSPFTPLNIYKGKSLFDINNMGLESIPHQFNYDLYNDPSIISLNVLQDSKNIDLEYDIFNKNLDINQIEEKNDIEDIFHKNFILFPPMKKCDLIEDSIDHLPITIYNDKIMPKNENQNENENALTNQNSGIFNKILRRKKINKLKKKIKFVVLTNQKQSSLQSQTQNSNKQNNAEKFSIIKNKRNNNNGMTNDLILKEFNEKNIIKNYKYKCEHPGCRKTFKTLKLKLNRHDISNCNCKKDTITLIYMIKNVKNVLKNGKKITNARIKRLKKFYKKCIFSLPHKDYAINIAGNDLIN